MSTEQDIKKMMRKLEKIKEAMQDDMLEVGESAVELIKKRTRLGFGVKEHGANKKKFPKLSDSYKKARKRHKPSGPTTPAKSNLTSSGDMLDDLEAKKKSDGNIKIGFSSKKSEDKAEWVSEDRPFNNLSKAEVKQLRQELDIKLKKVIKK